MATTKHLRVLMSFNSDPDGQVVVTGTNVIAGLFNPINKNLSAPPVDQPTMQGAVTDFALAIAASAQGGIHATAFKNQRRHDLIVILRKQALYVQGNCNDDLSILTSSGFLAASTVRTLGPLPKPVIVGVDNGHSTQLLVTIQKMLNAKSYQLFMAAMTGSTVGTEQLVGTFTKSRNLPVNGLTPGTNYAFRVRAVGGTSGYSDYSDPVIHMSL